MPRDEISVALYKTHVQISYSSRFGFVRTREQRHLSQTKLPFLWLGVIKCETDDTPFAFCAKTIRGYLSAGSSASGLVYKISAYSVLSSLSRRGAAPCCCCVRSNSAYTIPPSLVGAFVLPSCVVCSAVWSCNIACFRHVFVSTRNTKVDNCILQRQWDTEIVRNLLNNWLDRYWLEGTCKEGICPFYFPWKYHAMAWLQFCICTLIMLTLS